MIIDGHAHLDYPQRAAIRQPCWQEQVRRASILLFQSV